MAQRKMLPKAIAICMLCSLHGGYAFVQGQPAAVGHGTWLSDLAQLATQLGYKLQRKCSLYHPLLAIPPAPHPLSELSSAYETCPSMCQFGWIRPRSVLPSPFIRPPFIRPPPIRLPLGTDLATSPSSYTSTPPSGTLPYTNSQNHSPSHSIHMGRYLVMEFITRTWLPTVPRS